MILFFIFLFHESVKCKKSETLRYLNTIYRHGARSPVIGWDLFPSNKNIGHWKEGFGQLTNNGMSMHYELGQYIRETYPFLIPYNLSDIKIVSSDKERTIMSALANLAGLYPPIGDEVWNPALNWRPVPVHTIPKHKDKTINMDYPCPAYEKLLEKFQPIVDLVDQENRDFISMVSKLAGYSYLPFPDFINILSNIECDKAENLTMPAWLDDSILGKLTELASLKHVMFENNIDLKRFRGGLLLKEIIDSMKDKRANKPGIYQKAIIYSAHDWTIMSLLGAMGVFNGTLPEFASCVFFELHEIQSTWYVRIVYRRTRENISVLQIPGCGKLCQLDRFEALLYDAFPDDLENECNFGLSTVNN